MIIKISSSESQLLKTEGPRSNTEANKNKLLVNNKLDYDVSELTTRNDSEDAPQDSMKQISGLMVSIANIESSIIHMTHSATAKLNLYTATPPKTVSLKEDFKLSYQDLLDEL